MRFDWRVAVGDSSLSEEELIELAKAKDPFVRVAGRLARVTEVRDRARAEVPRAPPQRLGHRRSRPCGVGARHGRGTGLELGEVPLDESLSALLGDSDQKFTSRPTPESMAFQLFRFRNAAMAGCGCSAISAWERSSPTTWPRQDGAGDRDSRVRAGRVRRRSARADPRRLSDERRQAVGLRRSSASRRSSVCCRITASRASPVSGWSRRHSTSMSS